MDRSFSSFPELVLEAVTKNVCVKPFCTTCGALEFRRSLQTLRQSVQVCLRDIDIETLVQVQRWDEALRIAYGELSFDQQREVVQRWLEQAQLPLRFADVVVFTLFEI